MLWGYEHDLIEISDVLGFAKLKSEICDDEMIFQLSLLDSGGRAKIEGNLREIVKRHLVSSKRMPQRVWLFLLLSWLYKNRESVKNPLGKVEVVYSDFDCPEEISAFVGSMPPSDGYSPGLHTPDENNKRLLKNWKEYLAEALCILKE